MRNVKKFGLPYRGSKNSIAAWIVDLLPPADTFCDLFFGGGAVTHAAMLSGKYKHFIANDIDADMPKFFAECAKGLHTTKTHAEFITREKFHELKRKDKYISLCWSFGNNQNDYLYGKDVEPLKQALHNAVFFNYADALCAFGLQITKSTLNDIHSRYIYYKNQIKKNTQKRAELQSLERLESLERLQSLESLERLQSLENLEIYGSDYQSVPIPAGAVIYCDIPYKKTRCSYIAEKFDYARFYYWAEQQENIFISEYSMPKEFILVAERNKNVLSTNKGACEKAKEKIFTNKQTFEKYKLELQGLI